MIHWTICFLFFLKWYSIAQTQLNVFLEDINKPAFDKNSFKTIIAYLIMLRAIIFLNTSSPLSIFFSLFHLHA